MPAFLILALMLPARAQPVIPVAALDMAGIFDSPGPSITVTWEYLASPRLKDETQAIADCFAEMVDREFLPRDPYAGLEVVMTADRAAFESYMRGHYPDQEIPAFGLYVEQGKLVTFADSGFGTVTSLLLPGLLGSQYDDLPQWAMSGLRTYFEKVYGYWETDPATGENTIRFAHGYHNPWRLEAARMLLPDLKLADLVSDQPAMEDSLYQSQRRMLIMFVWKEGKLPAFVAALKARDRKMYPTYLEAVFGLPLETLQPRFRAFQESILAHWDLVARTPASQLYPDRAAFEAATAKVWR
ncbi:MAG: hypothetical protein AB7O49_18310 [Sphingomonadales bacterium]